MRTLILATLALLAPLSAEAGETVTYEVGGESFEGYRATAKGPSKGLVLIIHDWDGPDAYEHKRADMLSELGYDAFAIDVFGKGNRPATVELRRKETGRLYQDRERLRKLVLGGLDVARQGGDAKAVVMGYCFGGTAALGLARSGAGKNVAGYASFHGGLRSPGGGSYPKDPAPILIAATGGARPGT